MNGKIIPRERYIEKIRPYINKDIIKVLTGQRRVGKSYLLRSIEEEIKSNESSCNIIRIDLEDFAFAHITDAESLHREIKNQMQDSVMNYIFIDEIQEVEGFEKVIRSLNKENNTDIYVTGSNSSMLSAEIASRLAGRSMEIRVYPLTYKEFLVFHNLVDNSDAIELYLRYGGLPYLKNLPDSSTWNEYLSGLTDAILFRDIIGRHSIRNVDFLERLILFISDNIAQLFSAKRISDYIKSQKMGGTVNSVQTYLDYLCEAYIINKARRWDIDGKRNFEIGEKYYFEDLGIRNSIVGYKPADKAKLLENAVFNHLKANGYNVKIGILGQGKEIDFIAERSNELKYIQVALRVDDEKTREREFGNLLQIPDNYEKMVVTLYDSSPNSYNGVRLISLQQFLTQS